MSLSPINNENKELVKAHTILELTLENLEQLGGHGSIVERDYQQQIQSLVYLRAFIREMQRKRNHEAVVSDLVADIVHEAAKLLDSTDSYLYNRFMVETINLDEGTSSRPFHHSYFLSCSRGFHLLVDEMKHLLWRQDLFIISFFIDHFHKTKVAEAYSIVESALMEHGKITPVSEGDPLSSIYADLKFLRSSLKRALENSNRHQTIRLDLLNRIEVEVREFLHLKDKYLRSRDPVLYSPKIPELARKIKYFKQEVSGAEVVIGMEDETAMLLHRLIGLRRRATLLDRLIGPRQQHQVIPVIGIAGIGKTSLARKLYNHPSIAYHFHVRAWISVSQSYQEKKLLCDILSSIVDDNKDPVLSMSKKDIGKLLYKCLKGKKYLIVLDDVHDVKVWKGLKIYLPKDNNSSRIFITSQNKNVVRKIVPKSPIHSLRFLTEDESWDLFMCKVFSGKSFSEELMNVGKEIVAACKGLPNAIVVIGGLLAKEEKTEERWTQLAKFLSAYGNIYLKYLMDISAGGSFNEGAHFSTYDSYREFTLRHGIDEEYAPSAKSTVEQLAGGGLDEGAYSTVDDSSTPSANWGSELLDNCRAEEEVEIGMEDETTELLDNCSAEEEVVIGMQDETEELLDRLTGSRQQLEVILVIGMAGIGKTTLARKLYNDLRIAYHFHIRAWTSVSQSYDERKLLRDILRSIVGDKDPVLSFTKEDIREKLYKCLKGKRYLIVLDDVWDAEVWNSLQIYLPDDNNSSKVFITSRNKDVVPKSVPKSAIHSLRFLTEDESWDLFMCKVFGGKNLYEELMEVGKKIVATLKGLPIAIVVIGGLLAKEEKTKEKWTELAKTIRASASGDLEYLMDILALSYKHLPFPLKSCFLYLGSFPEDYEFPVRRLIRSWIAEGFIQPSSQFNEGLIRSRPQIDDDFIQQTFEMTLEDIAEGYLMNLIDRNLLIVAKRRSDSGIKSCKIHDLLRDLCIKKAEERNFLQPICRCGSKYNPSHHELFGKRFPDCHYFHFYDSHFVTETILDKDDNWEVVKLLRVLDLSRIIFYKFPGKIFELLHLKYLELKVDHIENLPPSIFELWNLETFILKGEKGGRVELIPSIMKMLRLRHFHVSKELFCDPRKSSEFSDYGVLDNLQTISNLSSSSSSSDKLHILLSRTPNLRKLGLHETLSGPMILFCSLIYSI